MLRHVEHRIRDIIFIAPALEECELSLVFVVGDEVEGQLVEGFEEPGARGGVVILGTKDLGVGDEGSVVVFGERGTGKGRRTSQPGIVRPVSW